MSASASGEGERAGDWDGGDGILPLPLDRVGVTARVFGAFEGPGPAAVVVREGRSEGVIALFNGLVPCPVARGGVFGRALVPVDGLPISLVVAV